MGIFGIGKAWTAVEFTNAVEMATRGYSNSGDYSEGFTDWYVKVAEKKLRKLVKKNGEKEITKEGWITIGELAERLVLICDEAGDEENKIRAEYINCEAKRIASSM